MIRRAVLRCERFHVAVIDKDVLDAVSGGSGALLARLPAFIRAHLGLDGRYSFVLPDLDGRPRPLHNPDAPDEG
ncbi:hypothetical protein AB0L63_29665 [Nocardia sp. NPDC051990]|uniref:hypothetical protein n=1 Tax=Nocardia sp. NPDC051990 TaxID=3155285 RepID=UPI0034180B26